MKTVTVEELEKNFDDIIDDVDQNKVHYLIKAESGDCLLIPYDSYEVLADAYESWLDAPKVDLNR